MSGKDLQAHIKRELGLSHLEDIGLGGGGCISQGSTYETDKYGRVFIKVNPKSGARTMFEGEFASLEALSQPNIVKVPRPIKVIDNPGGGSLLVMEYVEMNGLSSHAALLGQQLAKLHLYNASLKSVAEKCASSLHKEKTSAEYVSQFGFHVNTCCGYIPQDNTWCDSWQTFYANKIESHIKMVEKESGDRQARELWNKVVPKLSTLFTDCDIQPAILHGDLWGGNASQNTEGPVIFDPASFYGHSEYDLGISYLFGGFNSQFYKAYHTVIPKAPGFDKRKELYKLFHYLNHWNHFGGGYRGSSINTLQACVKHAYT